MTDDAPQTDLEIVLELMEDYDVKPEETLADLIEAINDAAEEDATSTEV